MRHLTEVHIHVSEEKSDGNGRTVEIKRNLQNMKLSGWKSMNPELWYVAFVTELKPSYLGSKLEVVVPLSFS